MRPIFYSTAAIAVFLLASLNVWGEIKRRPPPPPPPPPPARAEVCELPTSILSTTRKKPFSAQNITPKSLPTLGPPNLGPISMPSLPTANQLVRGEVYRLDARKLWQRGVYMDASEVRVFSQYNFLSLGKQGQSVLLRVPKPNKSYLVKLGISALSRAEIEYTITHTRGNAEQKITGRVGRKRQDVSFVLRQGPRAGDVKITASTNTVDCFRLHSVTVQKIEI